MSEQIISKQCSKCKQIKPLSEFYKDKSKRDGFYSSCTLCHSAQSRKYQKSAKGKASQKKRYLKWQRSQKGKIYSTNYTKFNSNKCRVRRMVNDAVKRHRMLPANHWDCVCCGRKAQEYHHKNYSFVNAFDVSPICIPCHRLLHVALSLSG